MSHNRFAALNRELGDGAPRQRVRRLSVRILFIGLVVSLALPLSQTASPLAAKLRRGTVTRTFANPTSIDLPVGGGFPAPASNLYPSEITVRGLKKGKIRDVDVRLNDLQHLYPSDVQVLLVGPNGQTAIVMANAGGSSPITDVTLTLDDEAAVPLPTQQSLASGAFRSTNSGNLAIEFNEPAPVASANAALSVFDDDTPNGTWRLFVQDKSGDIDGGVFAGGWAIDIEAKVKNTRGKRR
jgi:subtilisin-like proprotein convertase family protein